MDDLPLLPTLEIFDYLSIDEILNLKLVNKWFYQIINENVRIKELVISTHDYVPYNTRWFYTCDLISLQHLIKYDYHSNVYLNLNQPFLSKLKLLYINDTGISLETLNSLDQLVHLEIIDSNIYRTTDNDVLSLPLLEILNCDEDVDAASHHEYLTIDSTKLQRLRLYCPYPFDNNIKIVHPESITYLELYYYYNYKDLLSS